ncbi:MAG: alpha/beta hydrolase [Gammaproteobacteria bacterium]|nr:alpha/beta hydrolase [Gammaproteobacteria bacterium]MDE0649286.1 alpha/beta hydrolase [Gammaproteobacteria bacterium]
MRNVYFVTNRNQEGLPAHFGKRFSRNGISDLRFGRAAEVDDEIRVTVADENLRPDETGRGTHAESRLGSLEIFRALRVRMLEEERDTLVFIHGYNVDFNEGLRQAARLGKELATVNSGGGVRIALFSWPSDGSLLPWKAYASDRRDAAASGPALARAILKLTDYLQGIARQHACHQRVHLMAHSMGNYVLRHALQAIITHTGGRVPRVFDQVFLMAADEDDDAFEEAQKLRALPRIARRVNVYFNRQDVPLLISDATKGNPDRLGTDGARAPFQLPGKVTQIDCTDVVHGQVEHSYYVDTPAVVRDVVSVLDGYEPNHVPAREHRVDQNCYVIHGE